MIITKVIKSSSAGNFSMLSIREFWIERGFQFDVDSSDCITGKRGSFIGNLSSFDMSKLITEIHITRKSNEEFFVEYNINTAMQYITKMNRQYWDLELLTFEQFLNYQGENEALWKAYHSKLLKHNIRVILSVLAFFVLLSFLIPVK